MQFVVFFQILWAVGSIFWNLTGIDTVEDGGGAPVPEPSWTSIIMLLGLAILIMIFHNKRIRIIYRIACLGAAAITITWIFQAFSRDPELWVNDAWQWTGIIMNLAGFAAAIAGVFGRVRRQEYRPDPISPYFTEGKNETN
jgi:hypothetical protein